MKPRDIISKFKEEKIILRTFRDASDGPSLFPLRLDDCLNAFYHIKLLNFWKRENFDHFKYDFFSNLQNGYLNWIVDRKILAFSSPVETPKQNEKTLGPEAYIQLFKEWGVELVIRLNKPLYDKKLFEKAGINHLDLYFPDGSVPSSLIIKKFLEAVESCKGAVAIHCRAGLGRTGTLIGIYLMKHFGFGAPESIAFMRFLRPGCVLGI